jgi:hypothetical protein
MRGLSGAALLLLRAYDETGKAEFLDAAATGMRADLRRCVTRDNGSLEVNEGWRTMPYLDDGSAGIGLVLAEYCARRNDSQRGDDEQFDQALRGVDIAARSPFYIQPGLHSGRAGMLLYLLSRVPANDPDIAAHVRRLAWHGVPYGGGIAFPGTALLRLSMDLATGTAGVLLALGAALHDPTITAPLLPCRGAAAGVQTPAPLGAGS